MTVPELKEEVMAVIRDSTETQIPFDEQTHLIRELGLSSVETMMLVSDLEDRFGIGIPVPALRNVQTVGDLFRTVLDTLLDR